jgi:hypothetical protein
MDIDPFWGVPVKVNLNSRLVDLVVSQGLGVQGYLAHKKEPPPLGPP